MEANSLQAILDAIPSLVFLVDEDFSIHQLNRAAVGFSSEAQAPMLRQKPGGVLRCIHAHGSKDGCGSGKSCTGCVIRQSVNAAFAAGQTVRRFARMDLLSGKVSRLMHFHVSASPLFLGGRSHAVLVLEDISQVVELGRITPICMCCKKIRDDDQFWTQVEAYFTKRWDMTFSHGICPDCEREQLALLAGDAG